MLNLDLWFPKKMYNTWKVHYLVSWRLIKRSRIFISLSIMLYLPCYIVLICLTSSSLFATVVIVQQTKFMRPWIMRISLWKSTMQKSSSIGVILNGAINSWMADNDEFLNLFICFTEFCHLMYVWNFSNLMIIFPSPGFTISALSFMYTIWEIALQW